MGRDNHAFGRELRISGFVQHLHMQIEIPIGILNAGLRIDMQSESLVRQDTTPVRFADHSGVIVIIVLALIDDRHRGVTRGPLRHYRQHHCGANQRHPYSFHCTYIFVTKPLRLQRYCFFLIYAIEKQKKEHLLVPLFFEYIKIPDLFFQEAGIAESGISILIQIDLQLIFGLCFDSSFDML